MLRISEHLGDPHLVHRRFLTPTRHPLLAGPVPGERASAVFERMPDPPLEPAPLAGQQTRELAARLLGLSDPEIQALVDDGILEEAPPVPSVPPGSPVPPATVPREPS
jgi:crotonobetainyl-CoA:carnitine CoA-transferase CaiB-like acyl-CoA transferase